MDRLTPTAATPVGEAVTGIVKAVDPVEPFRMGNRLLVIPSWVEPAPDGAC